MSYRLNRKLVDLIPYAPIQGTYNIRLDANESGYNLSSEIAESVSEEIKKLAFNRYPDPYAADVIKAFADYYNIDKSMVTAGNGSDELISVIAGCFLEKGDMVVTLSPDFSMYAFYSSLYELNVEVFEKSDDLSIDTDALIDFCREKKTKALIFSNPCNPTSLGLEKSDIRRLIESLDCLIILDEAYMDFWTESMLGEINRYDNCIILKTCSKAVGMAAIRLGFAVGGRTITTALKAAKSPYNTDAISQVAGSVIFSHKAYLKERRAAIIANTQQLYNAIIDLQNEFNLFDKIYQSKTNFVFIKTSYYDKIFNELLSSSIAVRKFKGYLRITAGTEKENKLLLTVLKNIMTGIRNGG